MSELQLGQNRVYLELKAMREGLVVFLPEPNEVFLDIDMKLGRANERVLQCECPVALFETKEAAKQVEEWRANANTK